MLGTDALHVLQSIVSEYVEIQTDLERARDALTSLQDLCDMQAASLRAMHNRLENAHAQLEIVLRQNEALIEEKMRTASTQTPPDSAEMC